MIKDTICYILKNIDDDKKTYYLVLRLAILIHLKNREYVTFNSYSNTINDDRIDEYEKEIVLGKNIKYLKLKDPNANIKIDRFLRQIADAELKNIKGMNYYDAMQYIIFERKKFF